MALGAMAHTSVLHTAKPDPHLHTVLVPPVHTYVNGVELLQLVSVEVRPDVTGHADVTTGPHNRQGG